MNTLNIFIKESSFRCNSGSVKSTVCNTLISVKHTSPHGCSSSFCFRRTNRGKQEQSVFDLSGHSQTHNQCWGVTSREFFIFRGHRSNIEDRNTGLNLEKEQRTSVAIVTVDWEVLSRSEFFHKAVICDRICLEQEIRTLMDKYSINYTIIP